MTYVVQEISSKIVTTKYGPKPAYNIVANGETFGYGFKKPTVNVGDTIDFKYTENSYGKNIDATSLQMISKGDGVTLPEFTPHAAVPIAAPAPARTFGPPAKVFPIPPLHGDRAIVRQNALTNAREAVMKLDPTPENDERLARRIIAMARMFEAYSCGDLDLAEALKGK